MSFLNYFFRLNYRYRSLIRNNVTFIGGLPATPCIAIHVRHSDKVREFVPQPLVDYLAVATLNFPSIKNVFLMTDDPGVYQDAITLSPLPFNISYIQDPYLKKNSRKNPHAIVQKDQDSITLILIAQLAWALSCDYTVTGPSHLGDVIISLKMATSAVFSRVFQSKVLPLVPTKWKLERKVTYKRFYLQLEKRRHTLFKSRHS